MAKHVMKYLSKGYLLELCRRTHLLAEQTANEMTISDLRDFFNQAYSEHGDLIETICIQMDQEIANGSEFKAKRGRRSKQDAEQVDEQILNENSSIDSKKREPATKQPIESIRSDQKQSSRKRKTKSSQDAQDSNNQRSKKNKDEAPKHSDQTSLSTDVNEIKADHIQKEVASDQPNVTSKRTRSQTSRTPKRGRPKKNDSGIRSTISNVLEDVPVIKQNNEIKEAVDKSSPMLDQIEDQTLSKTAETPIDLNTKLNHSTTETVPLKSKKHSKSTSTSSKSTRSTREKQNSTSDSELTSEDDLIKFPSSSKRIGGYFKVPVDADETVSSDLQSIQKHPIQSALPQQPQEEPISIQGVLQMMPDGHGFLRVENYVQSNSDIYVSQQFIRKYALREGDYVTGYVGMRRQHDRYQALKYITDVNGHKPECMRKRPQFERLIPIYPNERFKLEHRQDQYSTRMIDLISPIGKGQRGMVVAPPKAGKTILLKQIANAITQNTPSAHLMVLLIDERPEEVTDMQRSIEGEIIYSTFDQNPERHVKVAELALERAKRMVELGEDVVILMDSITRLARAYNLTINPTGRTLSGGLDPGALNGPKSFFGAARNIENGGSLTVVATALVETGSRMDEVIFEEFKGTGNMEVYLDRKLSERRIFPAIDLSKSGTRREDLLMSSEELECIWSIRKAIGHLEVTAVTETILSLFDKTVSNDHFVETVKASMKHKMLESQTGVNKQKNRSFK